MDVSVIVHFFLFPPEVLYFGIKAAPVFSARPVWSGASARGETGFHTHCHSFSLLIPAYLYFSIIFFLFFSRRRSFEGG